MDWSHLAWELPSETCYWWKERGKGRRGRRRKQLPDYIEEKRGYRKMEEEALDRTVEGTRFGAGRGPVVRPRK